MPTRRDVIKATAASAFGSLPGFAPVFPKKPDQFKPGDVVVWEWDFDSPLWGCKLVLREDGDLDAVHMSLFERQAEIVDAETGEVLENVARYDARTWIVERYLIADPSQFIRLAEGGLRPGTILEHRRCIIKPRASYENC